MKNNKFLVLLLCLLCALSCVAFVACNKEAKGDYAITVEANDFGTVVAKQSANAGDTVKLNVFGFSGYGNYVIYVNGQAIEGDEFIMPEGDVTVNVSFLSTSGQANDIIVEECDGGQIVPSLLSAQAGQTIVLSAYSIYNRQLNYYTVNGEKIVGNSFPMPDSQVTVGAVFKKVYEDTDVKLSITSSYMRATSYWFAEYTPSAIVVKTVVEDDLIFTSKKGTTSVGMADNIEFIIGVSSSQSSLNKNNYKMLVSAIGEYYYQRYNGSSFVLASSVGIGVKLEKCNVFTHGFLGYKTTVTIPYSMLGTDYQTAYGNLTICPAMRNTTNTLKTNWAAYSQLNCSWTNPATHLRIKEDGTFAMNVGKANYLFAGDELLSTIAGNSTMSVLEGSYSYTLKGSTLSQWINNIEDITRYSPAEVYFACGSNDLKEKTVLNAFKDMRDFIDAFKEQSDAKLNVVSSLPAILNQDVGAVLAYNQMVKEYVETLENVEYVDFCSVACKNGKVNKPLYSSENTLSDEGNMLLAKQILTLRNLYLEKWWDLWGSTETYVASGNWSYVNGLLNCNGDVGVIYYKGEYQDDFLFEITLTANSITNGDAYPKFGFAITNGNHSRYYYISAMELIEELAGVVEKPYTGYDWTNSKTYDIKGVSYSFGNHAKLKLIKSGDSILFYVNDELIAETSSDAFGGERIEFGLFSFNIKYTTKEMRVVTDSAEIEKELG